MSVYRFASQMDTKGRQTDRQNRLFDSNVHNDIIENDKIKQYKVYNN